MEFSGVLYTYDEAGRRTAFESGPFESPKTVVFIGGLGDGYNALSVLQPLQTALANKGWSLIQVNLSSSYNGYGSVDLQTDSDELDKLVHYLKERRNKTTIVFLGHSTGSQDCYWHNKHGETSESVAGYILQAPVSDREYFSKNLPNYDQLLAEAIALRKENKGRHFLSGFMDVPITADRFYSLAAYRGDDDVFSTDLPIDTLKELYQGLKRPMFLAEGSNDEYYASDVSQTEMLERLKSVCPAIKLTAIVPDADHSLSDPRAQKYFIDLVIEFLGTLC
ncbi:hypothetical protein EC973_008039 [Apophysomyces ossiformis]|uniref:Uncharacterized protein n=1 Tax=Apophysomyces ossiformis TaxID=679940 RepID=A0A8H7BTD5_9FUNG|nr:hypothetical protein EC973_008039 [Apophysomyces ossiformis]